MELNIEKIHELACDMLSEMASTLESVNKPLYDDMDERLTIGGLSPIDALRATLEALAPQLFDAEVKYYEELCAADRGRREYENVAEVVFGW